MGDRANVLVKQNDGDPGVYLYTHWNGTELPGTLKRALDRRERWDDCSYLTRIVFDAMTDGRQGETIGYGISAFLCDGGDRVLIVDVEKQTISRGSYEYRSDIDSHQQGFTSSITKIWTFEEYVALNEAAIAQVWN